MIGVAIGKSKDPERLEKVERVNEGHAFVVLGVFEGIESLGCRANTNLLGKR